jgi:putative membrane protein (TIGR04086 family)
MREVECMKKGIRLVQGLMLSYMMTGIFLLIFSFLLYKMSWGEKAAQIGIVITYIVSTVVGGYYVGKKVETKRLIFGLIFGFLYFGIIAAVSFILYPKQAIFSGNFMTILGMCIGGGMLGSILS